MADLIPLITFSNIRDRVEPASPYLPFDITIEFRHRGNPHARFEHQFFVPNCLYIPFDEGSDGELGAVNWPLAHTRSARLAEGFSYRGALVPIIEQHLRKNEKVVLWTRRLNDIYQRLNTTPMEYKRKINKGQLRSRS